MQTFTILSFCVARRLILATMLTSAFSIFFFQSSLAQSIEGGCSTVTVTSTPFYSQNLYFTNVSWGQCGGFQPCCRVIFSGSPATPRFFLERKSGSSWTQVAGPQSSTVFNNLSTHGTYRVRIQVPVIEYNVCAGGYPTYCYNTLGQFIGYWGTWGGDTYSNTAIVGNTVPADNSGDSPAFFVDGGGGNSLPNGFDFGEIVTIDASGSQNYDLWWLAIIENGAPNRYDNNGWQSGTVGIFNLTNNVWKKEPHTSWNFETNNSYTVQFVVENSRCLNGSYWNVKNPNFFICPAGSGCRFGEEVAPGTAISPNPASHTFRLANFELSPEQKYSLTISGLSGKEIKSWQEWTNERTDVSDLPSGMYILNLWSGGKRLFADKLVVNR